MHPALKHDGELIAHTLDVDQPRDAVLVGFHSAHERLSCRCPIVMRLRIETPIGVLLNLRQAVSAVQAADVLGGDGSC
jgi:hypothetical protein